MQIIKAEVVIPDWVNWIAQDKDCCWWEYETKPELTSNCWDAFRGSYLYQGKPPKDFTQELYKWEWV